MEKVFTKQQKYLPLTSNPSGSPANTYDWVTHKKVLLKPMRCYAALEIIFEESECITQLPLQITIWLKYKALLEDLPKQMTSKKRQILCTE